MHSAVRSLLHILRRPQLDRASRAADHVCQWSDARWHRIRLRDYRRKELSSVTGEPVERLHLLRSLKLIGSEGDGRFAAEDTERIRLIQFLERRQIGLKTIARGERDEAILSSVVQFLLPHGLGPTYSLAQAIDIVGLDPEVARRLRDVAGASDDCIDKYDLEMLRDAKVALDGGFPETALRSGRAD